MATQTPTTHITAAVVSDDFTVTPVELDASRTLEEFYRLINCRFVDVVALDGNLDMWVDDEGMCTGSAPNWAITKVPMPTGSLPSRTSAPRCSPAGSTRTATPSP